MLADTIMSENSNEGRLAGILSQCAAEMLASLGFQTTILEEAYPAKPASESIAAFVRFGNDNLRGSLTLWGPSKLISRLRPAPPVVVPRDLDDWACEMVNQAVGRFRNRVATYGVKVVFNVPRSALAELLRPPTSHQPSWFPISFAIDDMVLECWIELEANPGFQLAESPLEEIEAALAEGSIVLF